MCTSISRCLLCFAQVNSCTESCTANLSQVLLKNCNTQFHLLCRKTNSNGAHPSPQQCQGSRHSECSLIILMCNPNLCDLAVMDSLKVFQGCTKSVSLFAFYKTGRHAAVLNARSCKLSHLRAELPTLQMTQVLWFRSCLQFCRPGFQGCKTRSLRKHVDVMGKSSTSNIIKKTQKALPGRSSLQILSKLCSLPLSAVIHDASVWLTVPEPVSEILHEYALGSSDGGPATALHTAVKIGQLTGTTLHLSEVRS